MRWAIAGVLVGACSFTPRTGEEPAATDAPSVPDAPVAPPDAPDAMGDPPPPAFALRVSADIDGRSQLVFRERTVHWIHFQDAAPGREAGANIATTLDAVEWQPVWPDVPTSENRNCNGCESDAFSDLALAVPRVPSAVTLARVAGNRDPAVVQMPDTGNNFTLIVELSDLGFGGSSIYTIDIDVTPL
jgi:hypothetical protein